MDHSENQIGWGEWFTNSRFDYRTGALRPYKRYKVPSWVEMFIERLSIGRYRCGYFVSWVIDWWFRKHEGNGHVRHHLDRMSCGDYGSDGVGTKRVEWYGNRQLVVDREMVKKGCGCELGRDVWTVLRLLMDHSEWGGSYAKGVCFCCGKDFKVGRVDKVKYYNCSQVKDNFYNEVMRDHLRCYNIVYNYANKGVRGKGEISSLITEGDYGKAVALMAVSYLKSLSYLREDERRQ